MPASRLEGLWSAVLTDGDYVADITGSVGATATFNAAAADSHVWSWVSVPGGSAIANAATPLPDNGAGSLMSSNEGLYHFEGSADDSSGNARNGAVSNATQVAGKVGSNSYQFNASSTTYITLGGVTDYHYTTGDFTICGWFKPSASQNSYAPLFSCLGGGGWGSNARGYWIDQNAGSTNTYRWGMRAGGTDPRGSDFVLLPGVWQHVAAVRVGSVFKVYVNGYEACSDTLAATIEQTSNGSALIVGRHGLDYTGSHTWAGDIDEIAIWSRALSAAEVLQVWQDGAGNAGYGASLAFTPDVVGTYQVEHKGASSTAETADAVISVAVAGGPNLSPASLSPANLAPAALSLTALSPK